MKCLSLTASKVELDGVFSSIRAFGPDFVLFFAAPSLLRTPDSLEKIKDGLSPFVSIGASTAGEIAASGVHEESAVFLAVKFTSSRVKTVSAPLTRAQDSHKAGAALGDALSDVDLRAVFVLGPGTHVNGSALVSGLFQSVGKDVVVTGGLAGDDARFQETDVFLNGELHTDRAVAIGFYGADLRIGSGSEGGWRPFGPARRVTRAESHILYALDNKPALQLYKEYLGERARDLPASGLLYPFAILREDRSSSGLIRSALDIDHEQGALILAGDLPQGSLVCLMHADTSALTQGAAQAAAEAMRMHGPCNEREGFALLVSCVGRKIVLGLDADDEIEAVTDTFEPDTPLVGFYSYGEICSFRGTGKPELHNQTMTITFITEHKD